MPSNGTQVRGINVVSMCTFDYLHLIEESADSPEE